MNQGNYLDVVSQLAEELENAKMTYQFVSATSLVIQGVQVNHEGQITLHVQWDLLEMVYELFVEYSPTEIRTDKVRGGFTFAYKEYNVAITCFFNTTVKTDPYRISVELGEGTVWVQSLYTYIYSLDESYKPAIGDFLMEKQLEMNSLNQRAWDQNNYLALLNRFGAPSEAAEKIKENPSWRIHPFGKYFGDVTSKNVIHLLGSNGVKGVALSLLGANVTIVDFSQENENFARELAGHAGVELNYLVTDVLSIPEKIDKKYDFALMELGVLHYFIDLAPLAKIIRNLLADEGKFILHEFHPISTKLIQSTGKKHKITGNYFDPSIKSKNVAFSKHLSGENETFLNVYQRQWTIGEVVTIFAQEQLYVEVLEEEPNHKLHDIGLPKTFTLVAKKIH